MTRPVALSADRRWIAYGALVVVLIIAATLVGKYRLVEPVAFATACEHGGGPRIGCLLREVMVALFVKNLAGMASTVLGVWSTVTRTRSLALAALAMGGISIVLYRYDSAVIGVMLGLLVLAREVAGGKQQAASKDQHHAREA